LGMQAVSSIFIGYTHSQGNQAISGTTDNTRMSKQLREYPAAVLTPVWRTHGELSILDRS